MYFCAHWDLVIHSSDCLVHWTYWKMAHWRKSKPMKWFRWKRAAAISIVLTKLKLRKEGDWNSNKIALLVQVVTHNRLLLKPFQVTTGKPYHCTTHLSTVKCKVFFFAFCKLFFSLPYCIAVLFLHTDCCFFLLFIIIVTVCYWAFGLLLIMYIFW